MKKKILLCLFSIICILGLTGCGKNANQKLEESKKYKLGESVESDILKLTLNKAELAVALYDSDVYFGTPKEYNTSEDAKNSYVAPKGHTFVAFTFKMENLDRTQRNFNNNTSVQYKDNTYEKKAQPLAYSNNNVVWKKYELSNIISILLEAGETKFYRAYIDIPTDADNLEDTFELTFYLPTSDNSKEKKFTYRVTKEDRDKLVEEEIPLDLALSNFELKNVRDYFKSHYAEYEIINANQINDIISNKNFNVVEVPETGIWKGTYNFESSGKIYQIVHGDVDIGYTNNMTWKIDGNNLIISSNPSGKNVKNKTYEMRKINGTEYYLLIRDNNPEILMN